MTRTTDDLQDAERFQPLGAPIPGVFKGADGRLYTAQPLPKEKP